MNKLKKRKKYVLHSTSELSRDPLLIQIESIPQLEKELKSRLASMSVGDSFRVIVERQLMTIKKTSENNLELINPS